MYPEYKRRGAVRPGRPSVHALQCDVRQLTGLATEVILAFAPQCYRSLEYLDQTLVRLRVLGKSRTGRTRNPADDDLRTVNARIEFSG